MERVNDHPSSFRDPSGSIFLLNNEIYRRVNPCYRENYEQLIDSGLYTKLISSDLLIQHDEVPESIIEKNNSYKIIKPKLIRWISYPFEWSFSQLKDAALTTLEIEKIALEYGMTLKDASGYNIQFIDDKAVFIDTLSFEKYKEGKPWTAYGQFCRHFLAPLALMNYVDIRLNQLLRTNIDGIPLDLASMLLPKKTFLNSGILSHIHFHSKFQQKYQGNQKVSPTQYSGKFNKIAMLGLLDNLESTINNIKWKSTETAWGDYYRNNNYSEQAFDIKKKIVEEFIEKVKPTSLWDLGANEGVFSQLASEKGIPTIAFDIDPFAVETNYRNIKTNHKKNQLPLLMDLTNPTTGFGWAGNERQGLNDRGPVDMILALAILHHLVIANNIPMIKVMEYFSSLGNWLIIEFVPKTDHQVQRLLSFREDIFIDYTQENFESVFSNKFEIIDRIPIPDTQRILYLLRKK